MKRLTFKNEYGAWDVPIRTSDDVAAFIPSQEIIDRLAAYEDTGLEPEEVAYCLGAAMSAKEAKAQYVEHKKCYDEYMARKQAEDRLVVLPCKPGDTVYYLTGNPALVGHFDRVERTRALGLYWDENGLQICLKLPRGSHGTYGYFEETVFLTREEAEAALEEVKLVHG